MTIDEAIARERKMVEIHKNNIIPKENYHNMPWIDKNNEVNMRNVEEHEQIAEWLEELKVLRHGANELRNAGYEHGRSVGYRNAIDDFVEACEKQFTTMYGQRYIDMRDIKNIAEQLKAGEKNE